MINAELREQADVENACCLQRPMREERHTEHENKITPYAKAKRLSKLGALPARPRGRTKRSTLHIRKPRDEAMS